VCQTCHDHLEPQQQFLSTNIANHQRVNNIDVASTNCNVRRYMNMPYSNTLGSEIRKAAYSTHNLFSQSLYYVRDKAIPLRLLAQAKGLAFITVVKGGFIFAPRLGASFSLINLWWCHRLLTLHYTMQYTTLHITTTSHYTSHRHGPGDRAPR